MSRPPRHACDPADFVRATWGLDVRAEPLPGEVDENWRLTLPSGERAFLRVAPPEAPLARLAALARLQADLGDEGWPVPVPYEVPKGRGHGRFLAAAEHRPEGGWASLATWLPGTPRAEVACAGPGHPRRLGRFLARLDRALAGVEVDEVRTSHDWELLSVGAKLAQLDAIPELDRRTRVRGWIETFLEEEGATLAKRPRTLLHGDGNDHNVLVGEPSDGERPILGLLDFGDCVRSVRVAEPAIAAAYAALVEPEPVRAAREVLAGYEEEWPLAASERATFVACVRMRVCQTAVTAAVRAAQRSEAYDAVHAAPAWALLDAWDTADWDALAAELRA